MINFYCNTHNNIEPLHTQGIQKTLMCGSTFLSYEKQAECIRKGHILDNTFDNISHLNHLLGDLTGLYWVWKNSVDQCVGVNQYCRFYDDQELEKLDKLDQNTIYISNFVEFGQTSIWQQFQYWHTDIGIRLLYSQIKGGKISISKTMADQMKSISKLSTCNSFFAHRTIFNRLCSVLFNIIFELLEGSKYVIEHIQYGMHKKNVNDRRLLAFLSERILNIIYNNVEHFLGRGTTIVPITFTQR